MRCGVLKQQPASVAVPTHDDAAGNADGAVPRCPAEADRTPHTVRAPDRTATAPRTAPQEDPMDPTRIAAAAAVGLLSVGAIHAADGTVGQARERSAETVVARIVRDAATHALLHDGRTVLTPADAAVLQDAGAHAAIVSPDGSAHIVVDVAGELWEAQVLPDTAIAPTVHSVRPAR